MQLEDVTGDVEIWPENVEAVTVFAKLRTQWRTGMAGLTGLVYAELWALLRALRVPRARWTEIHEAVQVMEQAVLEMVAEKHRG